VQYEYPIDEVNGIFIAVLVKVRKDIAQFSATLAELPPVTSFSFLPGKESKVYRNNLVAFGPV
jgi:hypothetical protein